MVHYVKCHYRTIKFGPLANSYDFGLRQYDISLNVQQTAWLLRIFYSLLIPFLQMLHFHRKMTSFVNGEQLTLL